MVIVTLEDFNRECKVDVEVKQHVALTESDEDGNLISNPSAAPPVGPDGKPLPPVKGPEGKSLPPIKDLDGKPSLPVESPNGKPLPVEEEPNVKVNLEAVKWADEVQVRLFGEGHILRTRELLERQLYAYYQWVNTPEPPRPPKDPDVYVQRLQQLRDIDQEVQDRFEEILSDEKTRDKRFLLEQQRRQFVLWQDTDEYERYRFLQEEYLESLKPPPPPRDWSQKEYPGLLELQNEQFLLWFAKNRVYLENLLRPEEPIEEAPIPPPTPPRPPKDVNVYIQNMQKMQEVADYWRERGPYIYWPDGYDPTTYFLELQRYWMRRWEYTEEYMILCRGVIRKKVRKPRWRALKWWEWKPVSNLYKEEREPTKPLDYGGLPKRTLSFEYKQGAEGATGEALPPDSSEEGDDKSVTSSVIKWDTETKKPYKSGAYNTELAEELIKMPENRIFWDKEPRPINMDAIYKETYEVIVKTQPNFI